MTRTTKSYAAVPPFGERIEELANGPALDEQRMRARCARDGVVNICDDAGVWAGSLVWREELNAWTCSGDAAHHLPLRRGTFAAAKTLLLRRVACSTRVEAKAVR